jgi:glycosyltransferase involved in cell wall biosynthesis
MEMFDTVTFVTLEDIEAMKQYTKVPNYMLLTNGTDIDKFSPTVDYPNRNGILFAGKLDIWANVLMVERIAKEIMPIVWQKYPETELTLVGANPSKSILALASDRIKIHSNVPEMTSYLQSASMFLHPHSGGSGIQNKLLEAMSCACPVVTTPTGMQGIPAVDGDSILIGRSNYDLAVNVIKLIEDKEYAAQLGIAGREVIVNNLSWEAVYRQIDNVIEATMLR